MRKITPLLVSGILSLAGCNSPKVEPKPPEKIILPEKHAPSEDAETLVVKIFADEEVNVKDLPLILSLTEESISFYKAKAESSARSKGVKFSFHVEFAGLWDSDDKTDDCELLLEEFKKEAKGTGDIALAFTGQEVGGYVGYADDIPGRYAIISADTSPKALRSIILHEIGHNLGLFHDNVAEKIMYPREMKGPGILSEIEAAIATDTIISFLNFKSLPEKKVEAKPAYNFPLLGMRRYTLDFYLDYSVSFAPPVCSSMTSIRASGSFNISVRHPAGMKEDACNLEKTISSLNALSPLPEDIIIHEEHPDEEETSTSKLINLSADFFLGHYHEILSLAVEYRFMDSTKAEVLEETMDLAKKLKTNPFMVLYQLK